MIQKIHTDSGRGILKEWRRGEWQGTPTAQANIRRQTGMEKIIQPFDRLLRLPGRGRKVIPNSNSYHNP